MIARNTIKRALEAAGFVFLRGGWVRKTAAPRLQDKIDKAVRDAADDVAAVKSDAGGAETPEQTPQPGEVPASSAPAHIKEDK